MPTLTLITYVKRTIDQETTVLANKLRDVLGAHMAKIETLGYHEILTSCLTALACETGRLKWLVVSTDKIDPHRFDEIFKEGLRKTYNENVRRYGISANPAS